MIVPAPFNPYKEERMSVTFQGTVLIEGVWRQAFNDPAEPRMNLSNANAAGLLRWLGLPFDREYLMGEFHPDEIIGACLVALAIGNDAGQPVTEHNDSRFIDCGREPGYFNHRATMLLELAEFCKRRGAQVGFA